MPTNPRDTDALNRSILRENGLRVALDSAPAVPVTPTRPKRNIARIMIVPGLLLAMAAEYVLITQTNITGLRSAIANDERTKAAGDYAVLAMELRNRALNEAAQCPSAPPAPDPIPPQAQATAAPGPATRAPQKGAQDPPSSATGPPPTATAAKGAAEPSPSARAPILALEDKPHPAPAQDAAGPTARPQPPVRASQSPSILGQALPFEITQAAAAGISAITPDGVDVLDSSGKRRIVRIGEALPDGSRVLRIDPKTGVIVTDHKVIKIL